MIPVMAIEGFLEGIDRGRTCKTQGNIPAGGPILGPFAILSKGSLDTDFQGSLSLAAGVLPPKKAGPIRPAVFAQRTNRKFRCDAPPAPEAELARPQLAEAVAEPAKYRTSSNRPVCRLPCGQWAHNCRHARSRPWAPISFAPMRVMQSGELPVQASSSLSLAEHALFGLY